MSWCRHPGGPAWPFDDIRCTSHVDVDDSNIMVMDQSLMSDKQLIGPARAFVPMHGSVHPGAVHLTKLFHK